MVTILAFGLIVLAVGLIYRRGRRVAEEMGIGPRDMPIEDAVRARYKQRQMREQIKAAGASAGDSRLGEAMAEAATETDTLSAERGDLAWEKADEWWASEFSAPFTLSNLGELSWNPWFLLGDLDRASLTQLAQALGCCVQHGRTNLRGTVDHVKAVERAHLILDELRRRSVPVERVQHIIVKMTDPFLDDLGLERTGPTQDEFYRPKKKHKRYE